jgi:glutathione synthase/RimK-type ligase-like ATP-grasp enzyme
MHVNIVIKELLNRGIPYFRWNLEDFLVEQKLVLRTNTGFHITVEADNKIVSLDKVKVVWYRRPGKIQIHRSMTEFADFIRKESDYLINGIFLLLKDRFWIVPPRSTRIMDNKIFQLWLANQIGFRIPKTVVTNNPAEAERFLMENKECVLKVISPGLTKNGKTIYTNKIDYLAVKEHLDTIACCPVMLQEYIHKTAELRITVIEKEIFACLIESQAHESTKIDWRRIKEYIPPHRPYDLPVEVGEKILKFMDARDMLFATFDFAITPDGDFVFFECNPNGQWYWVELLTGLPITSKFVDFITSKL